MELTLGQTLSKVRIEKKLREKSVCDGICSTVMMNYYEKNEQVPDCLLFICLMERMGVSSEEFALMVSENEYKYIKWQTQIYDAIDKGDWGKLGRLLNVHVFPKEEWINEKIQRQFFHYVKGIFYGGQELYNFAIEELKKAMDYTIPRDLITKERILFNSVELHILLLYIFYGRKSKLLDEEKAKKLFTKMERYISDGIMDRNEKAKIYPKLAGIALNGLGDLLSHKEKMALCEKAVHILRENKTFHGITEIFRIYIPLLENVQSNNVGFYKKQYEVFCNLLQEENNSIAFRPEIHGFHRAKVYLRGEYFSYKRRERGFTQEEVSEDICAPETYSRLERGERKPTRKNSRALAEKLGINWVQFRGELFSTDLEAYQLRRLERRASIEGRWNDSLEILHTLESCLDMNVIENYQYVKACECVSMLQLKRISTEEACSKLEELLDMTCVLDIDDSHLVYYSQSEMEIIADLALLYKRLGNVSKGIKLIENVIKQMSHSQLGYEDQWNGFSYLFRMLARLYFESEDYDTSVAISKYIKSVMIQRRNGYNLPEVLDEIADGLEHQGEQYSEEYRKLYRYTFYVADFFGIEKAKKFAQQYYEEKFDSGIVWYIN